MSLPRSFGAYTLLRRLAVGGMAEIYVAKTLGLGGFEKLAALKLVHPHLSADPQFIRMLIDEAKIVVMLTHANIAQVFDLGCVENRYFIAMEYVDGVDVQGLSRAAERLGRGLDVPVCCFVMAELLNGLDYAHKKRDQSGRPLGIVHRDISPQNVVVSRAGEVKLVDFGIAKTNLCVERTEVGVIKGKYGYMSPEQAWADPTDRRSDVFSAGIMLYELLTGTVLYTAKSIVELIAKVRRAEIPPPSSVRASIHEDLSEIVMRALALEPSDRYQSAQEMSEALRAYLHRSGQSLNGARLGRFVVELLEADERLADENARRADETGGLHALRREEFVRSQNSMIFSAAELSAAATRSEGLPVRHRGGREGNDTGSLARAVAPAVAPAAPEQAVVSSSHAPALAPTSQVTARTVHAQDNAPQDPSNEDPTEVWTARWFAEQGALDFVTEIRVQAEPAETTPPVRSEQALLPAPEPTAELVYSVVPPTLSWPPTDIPVRAPSQRPLLRDKSPSPPALMPPRGEDPSLAPLPRMPDPPNFRRRRSAVGRRHVVLIALSALIGGFGAWLAWENAPICTLELLSSPRGASVQIDGSPLRDKTPLRITGLRRGVTYRVRLDLPGHSRVETLFQAEAGTSRRTITLPPD